MRSDAAIACCRLALTRLSFLTGAVHHERGGDERSELALRHALPRAICVLPYHISADDQPTPPSNSISGGRIESALVTFMFVRYSRCGRVAEPLGLVRLGAERLDDAVAGERLGA